MRLPNEATAHLLWIGLFFSSLPANAMPGGAQQSRVSPTESNWTANSTSGGDPASPGKELPDSPSATRSALQDTENPPGSSDTQSNLTELEGAQSGSSMPSAQHPVGTAAAGPSRASGVAAAQPAGIAVAPAKQRRVRTIVLRFGAIVGVGAAVGTVVALSRATPSKPPGTR
jgi:hypothetical protein